MNDDAMPARPPAQATETPASSETSEERAARRRVERARAIAYLDLEESRGPVALVADDAIGDLLRATRRIAVVGASSNEGRPSFGVFRYLIHQGYECVPINPGERSILGVPAFRTLREAADATGPFDLVDVVVNWEAARIAHDGGLAVVMDRCTAIEHRRLRNR
jgi:uncharacterized protein